MGIISFVLFFKRDSIYMGSMLINFIKIGLLIGYVCLDLSTIVFILQQICYVGVKLIL